jgi:RNA polymerase sigma factor (sigma-70 family)
MSKEEAKYKKYETPQESPTWERSAERPTTPYQALMEAAPFEPVEISIAELLEVREVLVDALETLTEEETWVINSLITERMSIRQLARQLGAPKTTITRIRDRALSKLEKQLENHPVIIQLLKD